MKGENPAAFCLRLLAAIVWAAMIGGDLLFDAIGVSSLIFAGYLGLALIPHSFLKRRRALLAGVLAVSILPFIKATWMLATIKSIDTDSIAYLFWLAGGLGLVLLSMGLLPASLLISLYSSTHTSDKIEIGGLTPLKPVEMNALPGCKLR